MKQLLSHGNNYSSSWGADKRVWSVHPGWDSQPFRGEVTGGDVDGQYVIPADGSFSRLKVRLDNLSFGGNLTMNAALNGVTQFNVGINTNNTYGENLSSFNVTAGDLVEGNYTIGSGWRNDPTQVRHSLMWEGANSGEAIMLGGLFITTARTHTNLGNTRSYNHVSSPDSSTSSATWHTTESDVYFYVPMNATIKSFYVNVVDTVTPDTLVFSIFKNGSEEATSQVSYSATDTGVKSATGLSIDIAPGDTITISGITTGTGTISESISWGIMYTPDVDGESMYGGWTTTDLSTTQDETQYEPLVRQEALTTTDNEYTYCGDGFRVKSFRVHLSTAPGASESRTFKIRKNQTDGNGSITISDTATSGSDLSSVDTFKDGDTMSMSLNPDTSSTAATKAFWSMVMYDVFSFTPQVIVI